MKISRKVRLGQHFLMDKNLIDFIIKTANLTHDDIILEVGAGYGNLTVPLANASKKVIAIEKDPDLFNILTEKMIHFDNVEIYNNDIFEANIPRFNKIVSSLPYSISSKFFKWLLRKDFELGVLVLQKEFASKLTSKPGSKQYCKLTVLAQHEMDVNILKYVSPRAFKPPPKVTSCIVKSNRLKHSFNNDLQFFFENMVNSLFSTKRKMVTTAVRRFCERMGFGEFNSSIINNSIIIGKRVYELSVKELEKLAFVLYKIKHQ